MKADGDDTLGRRIRGPVECHERESGANTVAELESVTSVYKRRMHRAKLDLR